MPRTAVMVRFEAKPGDLDRLAEHLQAVAQAARREPGVEWFSVYRSPEDPASVWLHEVYVDESARHVHESSAAYIAAREKTRSMLAGPPSVQPLLPEGETGPNGAGPAVVLGYVVAWVDDVEAALQFHESAFGVVRRTLEQHGDVLWGELQTGTTVLAFASTNEAERLFPQGFHPVDASALPAAILVSFLVDDVDAAFRRAVTAGATPLDPPRIEPWGQTVARLRSPQGLLVSLATPARNRRAPG